MANKHMPHRSIRINKRRLIGALCAAVLIGCTPNYAGEKIMTELTKTMRPVCVGRFVVEIPTAASIKGWDQKVDMSKIETVFPPALNKMAFENKVAQRETLLKTSPHETDGVLFKNKIQLTPESDLFVYRENESNRRIFELEAWLWRPTLEMKFHAGISDRNLASGIERITKVVKSFTPLPTSDTTHLPAGLCIEKGIITGSHFRAEEVAIAGRIDAYPGAGFSFSTRTAGKPHEGPTMIQRIDRSFGLGDWIGKEATAATKFLRKGKRSLNGQQGEELVAVFTKNGEMHMQADAEFYPEPNTLDKPSIKVSLGDQTHDDNTHARYPKNLTQEEFLALWDALLNGIKLRPGAI
ncbi:MAG: T6SS immunity protein Tli4 family protein [Gammaproteobacteria bacterium]